MKKRVSLVSLLVVLSILLCSAPVFALTDSNTKYSITSVQQLIEISKSLGEDGFSAEEKSYLIDNTDPVVLEAYYKEMDIKIIDAMNQLAEENQLVGTDRGESITQSEDAVVLEDGTTVTLIQEVGEDSSYIGGGMGIESISGENTYGSNKYYYCEYDVAAFYPSGKIALKTYFNASKTSGFTATSTNIAGTSAFWPVIINGSSQITDKYAPIVGHDINGQGNYDVYINIAGVNVYQRHWTMTSYIKLTALNETTYGFLAYNVVD